VRALNSNTSQTVIAVTDWHGAMAEQADNAAENVSYVEAVREKHWSSKFIRSPVKGFLPAIPACSEDIVEGVVSPVITTKPWVYSLATYEEALSFSVLGLRTPRFLRQAVLNRLFFRKNFLGFCFWSNAGLQTLKNSGVSGSRELLLKSRVIYPAISRKADRTEGERNTILFSGDFFRKGGVNVVDAFEKISERKDGLILRLCCDAELDFNTTDQTLRNEYINKIRMNPKIVLGRVPRRELLQDILPNSLLYLLPSYDEAFGFAILEAMAEGVPVVATREFAIPEMIDDGETGWLIDFGPSDKKRIMNGYVVKSIPEDIRVRLTDDLHACLVMALGDRRRLSEFGERAQHVARTRFSFEIRNESLRDIYQGNSP
jgi:glycosyltransferase involved in cell wall biosynthesis